MRAVEILEREFGKEVDRLKLDLREAETRLKDEQHDFIRRQKGMSMLVTVLLQGECGEHGDVSISREEFVRLATDASAANEDNSMLREELRNLRDELGISKSKGIAHKMAIEEVVGLKIAEVIDERDHLQSRLRESNVRLSHIIAACDIINAGNMGGVACCDLEHALHSVGVRIDNDIPSDCPEQVKHDATEEGQHR